MTASTAEPPNALAIITARGGSKRIPRKNIRPFHGRPVIAYSIQAALESGLFREVMVSTDDVEIAGVARRLGAQVPFMRMAATADDRATTAEVIHEVLAVYAGLGEDFTHACCLYPTAPFVTPQVLRDARALLSDEGPDTVFPIAAFSAPVERGLLMDGDGRLRRRQPEHENTRSQDLPTTYHDAGQFYWLEVSAFLQRDTLLGANSSGLVVSELSVQDIDDEHDWAAAEAKFRLGSAADPSCSERLKHVA